jgi:Flp pilus assembly protein TadG
MAEMKRRRGWGDDRGAELIELALILPILMLVFAAIIDFGFLFQRYEVLTNASREGARLGSLDGYSEPDVDARVAAYLTSAGLTVTGDPTTVVYSDLDVDPSAVTKNVRVITVTVQYPAEFFNLGPFTAILMGSSSWSTMTLHASSTMRTEIQSVGGS